MSERTLLRNGCVLTLDPALGNHRQADVLIEGSKIKAVAPSIPVGDAYVIDATDTIVMPGFVDTHRHIWEGILRNIAPDALLDDYFRDILGVLAPVYRPQDAYAGNLVSAYGAIDAGITTLLDWSHIQNTPEHTDASIAALQESGLRARVRLRHAEPRSRRLVVRQQLKHPTDIARIAPQYFSAKDQLMTLALAPRGPEFTTPEVSKHDWDLAREVGCRISVHVGVGEAGKHGRLGEMGKAGLLGPDTTYIHCCTLSDEELQMIADTGGTVSLASPIELQMGHGTPPIQRCLDRGLRPSLSVDVETTMCGDLFAQMRSVLTLQRGQVNERRLRGETDLPKILTSRDVHRLCDDRRRQGQRPRQQGRHADSRQGSRHHHAAHRPHQRAADQRPDRRRGARHGLVERRLGVHRRQAEEAARPPGQRRSRPRDAARLRVARLRRGEVGLRAAVHLGRVGRVGWNVDGRS